MWSLLKCAVQPFSEVVWNMLNGILANEDRKLGCTGQGTTIVCLEQDAASHCFHIEDIHFNTTQPPTLFWLLIPSLTLGLRAGLFLRRWTLKPCQTGMIQICNREPKIESLSEEMFYVDKLIPHSEFLDNTFVKLRQWGCKALEPAGWFSDRSVQWLSK